MGKKVSGVVGCKGEEIRKQPRLYHANILIMLLRLIRLLNYVCSITLIILYMKVINKVYNKTFLLYIRE